MGANASSNRAAAASWRPGATWLYRSSVVEIVAWPNRSRTTVGCTFCFSRRGVWICLPSWDLKCLMPVRFTIFIQAWLIVSGRPTQSYSALCIAKHSLLLPLTPGEGGQRRRLHITSNCYIVHFFMMDLLIGHYNIWSLSLRTTIPVCLSLCS